MRIHPSSGLYGGSQLHPASIRDGLGKRTLNHHHSALEFLRHQPRQRRIGEVPSIPIPIRLSRREQDDRRPRPSPVLRVPPYALPKRAKVGVIMIEQLLEGEDARVI